MSTTFGITSTGFTLKRLYDIISDMNSALALVQDPVTGEYLNLTDENDPFNQLKNAVADQLAVCWEQLQMVYNQFDPLQASGSALSGLVQLNGLLRNAGESDTDLRLRQQEQVAVTSASQIESIYAAVAEVTGVQFCRAYQNSTLSDPDGRGIPAKAIAIVVVGGDDQSVADAIFSKVNPDAANYGTTTATSHDSLGIPYTVKFSRPTSVPITIVVNVSVIDTSTWPSDGADQIKAALVTYSQYGQSPNLGLPPGASVVLSRLYSPINSIPGHEINSILLARDAGIPAAANVAIAWNEVAAITTGNITVNLT